VGGSVLAMSYTTPRGYDSSDGEVGLPSMTPHSDPTGNRRVPVLRDTLYRAPNTKTCYFYKDGDARAKSIKLTVNPKSYGDLDVLQTDLSQKIRGLPFGCRSIYTPRGHDQIRTLSDLEHDGHYVCSTHRSYAHGLDLEQVRRSEPPKPWHGGKPPSGKRRLNDLLKFSQSQKIYPSRRPKKAWNTDGHESGPQLDASVQVRSPKKVRVYRNGDPSEHHVLLLNRRTAQSFEHVMDDLSGMFSFQCAKLYTQDGKPVSGGRRSEWRVGEGGGPSHTVCS
jgi:hypothetical protein